MKKYLSIFLLIAMFLSFQFSFGAADENSDMVFNFEKRGNEIFDVEEELVDKKVYCDMTIDDDFIDTSILVVLEKEKSREKDKFVPEDFPEIDCIEIIEGGIL